MLVRMTSDLVRLPEKRYNYSNAISGLVSLIREEGVQGLARGLGTNTVCAWPFSMGSKLHFFSVSRSFDECA